MRALRKLTLLLALVAPAAFADTTYQVEMILVRQNAVPAITGQFAPEDWREGAEFPAEGAIRQPVLNDQAEKLAADPQYTVLLHKAWRQSLGSEPARVAISDGKEQFGHFPIEGNLALTESRFINADVKLWVNTLGADGSVLQSEAFSQSNGNMKVGELTFLDGGHLAVLLKVTPEGGARPSVDTNEIAE
jgi:hypothetical protein